MRCCRSATNTRGNSHVAYAVYDVCGYVVKTISNNTRGEKRCARGKINARHYSKRLRDRTCRKGKTLYNRLQTCNHDQSLEHPGVSIRLFDRRHNRFAWKMVGGLRYPSTTAQKANKFAAGCAAHTDDRDGTSLMENHKIWACRLGVSTTRCNADNSTVGHPRPVMESVCVRISGDTFYRDSGRTAKVMQSKVKMAMTDVCHDRAKSLEREGNFRAQVDQRRSWERQR